MSSSRRAHTTMKALSLGLALSLTLGSVCRAEDNADGRLLHEGLEAPYSQTLDDVSIDTGLEQAQSDTDSAEPEERAEEPPDEADPLASLDPATRQQLEQLTASLHHQHRAINQELRDDAETSTADIAMLWQAAVERSGTIRYAIEKLSRTDATGEPVDEDSFTKRLLHSMTRIGGVAGSMWTGSPAGLIGGNMIDQLMAGDPNVSAMQRVTDADMLILAKEVEALQSEVIQSYYAYRQAKKRWELTKEARRVLGQVYDQALNDTTTDQQRTMLQPVLDSLYANIRQEESAARQNYVSQRNALGLLVGGEALLVLEKTREDKTASR